MHIETHFIPTLILIAAFAAPAFSQAPGAGTKAAEKIVERVEAQETKSSAQEKLVDEISDAAKEAGKKHPNDAEKVKKAVKDKLDEIRDRPTRGGKPGGLRNKEIREWIKKLKRELMDGGQLSFAAGANPGEQKGEEIAERVEAEETSSSAEEQLVEEIAETARKAGKDNPKDPEKVKDAVKDKLDEIRDRASKPGKPGGLRNKEIREWIKKLKRALLQRGYVAMYAREGSRILMSGTVVAGQPATLAAVDRSGARLSGVVISVAGEEYVTDDQGQVTLPIAVPAGALLATFVGRGQVGGAVAEVLAQGAADAPTIANAPPHLLAGNSVRIQGDGFTGDAAGNRVYVGETSLEVLACSPTEIVAEVPRGLEPGAQPLTVQNAAGSDTVDVEIVALQLASEDTRLRPGQPGIVTFIIIGTQDPVNLVIDNLAPQTIAFDEGATVRRQTSGGATNTCELGFTAVQPGGFEIAAHIEDTHAH